MRSEVDWPAIAAAAREEAGLELDTRQLRAVSGGSIHEAWRVPSRDGACFVKVNDATCADLFAAEADGLEALGRAGPLRVPRVLARGVAGGSAFLVLEWVEAGAAGGRSRALLGTQLAALHRHLGEGFGWRRDNYIGRTPQPNGWSSDWIAFLRRHRIGFQLDLATRNGDGTRLRRRGERLLEVLDCFFDGYVPAPSLLHGDLWGGNWHADRHGTPVVFDPAVHYGDRESDLAMTALFGGFGAEFYDAYAEAWPLAPGHEARRDLYQLYHLLNHLNLFGGSYLGAAAGRIDRLLAEAGVSTT
jgi:fructosamine-3-kinase